MTFEINGDERCVQCAIDPERLEGHKSCIVIHFEHAYGCEG